MEEEYKFVSPIQRIEMKYRKELALIQQREHQLIRDSNKTEEQRTFFANECNMFRKQQLQNKTSALQHEKEVSKMVGTGCECNKPKLMPELESVLQVYNLIQDVARLIIEYLPPGSTRLAVLSIQQRYIIQLIMSGKNVFFTGKAG